MREITPQMKRQVSTDAPPVHAGPRDAPAFAALTCDGGHFDRRERFVDFVPAPLNGDGILLRSTLRHPSGVSGATAPPPRSPCIEPLFEPAT